MVNLVSIETTTQESTGLALCERQPPTIREIAEGVGLKSSASVYEHIKMLMQYGLLETDAEAGTPRAIRLPNMKIIFE